MRHQLVGHLKGNVVAYLALFVALGGTAYAATQLPANSVGSRQIRNHSITPVKFDRATIGANVRLWAVVDASGHIVASHPRAKVVQAGPASTITWGTKISRACFPLATVGQAGDSSGVGSASVFFLNGTDALIRTYDPNGSAAAKSVIVAILCP